jgi:phage repressor protein C with HTH and peptisase S24 domain
MKQKVKTKDLMELIEETVTNGQKARFKVTGTSMEPFFKDGLTSVTLEKKTLYRVNDVVLFKYQETFKLHRITRIKQDAITCMGDNLLSKEITKREDIIGVVTSFETSGMTTVANQSKYRTKVLFWRLFRPITVRWKRNR